MPDYYYKDFCSKCNTKNWFSGDHYDGDCSKSDPSPIHECFKCHHKYINPDDVNSIEDICQATDHSLWEDVNEDIEEFIKQYNESEIGRETIE